MLPILFTFCGHLLSDSHRLKTTVLDQHPISLGSVQNRTERNSQPKAFTVFKLFSASMRLSRLALTLRHENTNKTLFLQVYMMCSRI